MRSSKPPLLLVISQVYVPDPASVGQHMADVAERMASRGYTVRVLTSRAGYDDPRQKYPARERRADVDVVRLPLSSLGKKTLIHRLIGQALFLGQVIVRGVFTRGLTKIFVSTSPPMATFAAVIIGAVRRVPITYWVMDINPDQAIALGKVNTNAITARLMRWLNRTIFARASEVIVLDRFMAERVRRQYRVGGRMEIIPPWPHEGQLQETDGENAFRTQYNPFDKFVVMYSGNHSVASPISTLLEAAVRLKDDSRFLFMFVGGGQGKREVDEAITNHRPANILSLPYQPLDMIRHSLRAADLHVVTLGDNMVGIVHPCKIYNAMAIGRPIVFIGPRPSHAADLLEDSNVGWHVNHGDVFGLLNAIQTAASLSSMERKAISARGQTAIADRYSESAL